MNPFVYDSHDSRRIKLNECYRHSLTKDVTANEVSTSHDYNYTLIMTLIFPPIMMRDFVLTIDSDRKKLVKQRKNADKKVRDIINRMLF